MPLKCSKCHTELKSGEEYHHHSEVLCEACCMDTRRRGSGLIVMIDLPI